MERYQFTQEQRRLMEGSKIPFAIYQFIDKRVVTLILSKGFCEMLGYDDMEQAYHDMDDDMYKDAHPDDAARIENAALQFAIEGKAYDVVYRSKNKDKTGYNIIHATGEHVNIDGVQLAQVWYMNEGEYSTLGKSSTILNKSLNDFLNEESLVKSSYYDYLTGLPSMTHFFELANAGRDRLVANQSNAVMLFFDYSGMKYYNSQYGFSEGDRLIREFSKVLVKHFTNENCSRFGQDHFAVYTEDRFDIEETVRKIFLENQNLNGGKSLPLRVGIYKNSMGEVDASIASDRAKLACNALRDTYVSGFSYFNHTMLKNVIHKQYIIDNIDKAIQQKWIKVYYQPIVRAVNGRVCDEEALARWVDPTRGMIQPNDFVPALEGVKLVYKLDLFVLEEVLLKLKQQKELGLHLVPQSINLSKYDFDSCDMVEEIRKRVDASGIDRQYITIEITESVVGSEFEFIKEQVYRFRELGFAVWLDDFGSGYSSLNVLQSIKFDLIKFDMSFMKQLNEDENNKVLLSELIKMVTLLDIDTVCEGIETLDQVRFLQEIGCSKLQGYYYCKPIPFEQIINRYKNGEQIGFESPEQSSYYEVVGRTNLNNLSTIANEEDTSLENIFNVTPMAIIEINDSKVRYIRSNKTFRKFMRTMFALELSSRENKFAIEEKGPGATIVKMLNNGIDFSNKEFYDERVDKNVVHYFARRVSVNKVTNTIAIAVAILYISNEENNMTYANIARALSMDYFDLFYVDIESEKFIEYSSKAGQEKMTVERHGVDFFNLARSEALKRIHPQDLDFFVSSFTKENILAEIKDHKFFSIAYRLVDSGEPVYVNMKVSKMDNDDNHIVVGVLNIDAQMKAKVELEKIRRDQITYSRIMALTGDYVCIYVVDPLSGRYLEYSASGLYDEFGFAKSGENFYLRALEDGKVAVSPDDLDNYLTNCTKEKILEGIKEKGLYSFQYKLLINKVPTPVALKAAIVKEDGGEKMIVGVSRIHENSERKV